MANITIEYFRIIDGVTPAVRAASNFPEVCFIFDIFGIDEDNDKNLNGSRMFK